MQGTRSPGVRRRPEPKTALTEFPRSPCPVACSLDLFGDKWTLLVVRDMLAGSATYGDLQHSPENIPTNILADRLKRLEEAGLVAKSAYQQRPVRYAYELTEKGKSLRDVLLAIVRWGEAYIPGTRRPKGPAARGARSGGDAEASRRKR